MNRDAQLRDHVVRLLTTPWAHVTAEAGLADVSPEHRSARPPGHAHTLWQLLEHLRICQHDLVEYSQGPDYDSPPFPDGYWPESDTCPDDAAWESSLAAFRRGLAEMVALVQDPERDLLAPLPWSPEGHTLLREALILADHNAYHLGQVVQLRKVLGAGPA